MYRKDNLLMIRDGSGSDREMLKYLFCKYYKGQDQEDMKNILRR